MRTIREFFDDSFHDSPRRRSAAKANSTTGFSLIELLVVMGIFVILTSVILASNTKFGGAFSLQNLAYDVGLSIRQAQIYGISVQKSGSGAGTFTGGYGINFKIASPTSYVLFVDNVQQNGRYSTGELVSTMSIGQGYRIVDLCVTISSGQPEACGQGELDIHFKRPEPDAYIRGNTNAENERGRIILESPRGDRISIIVEVAGGISIQK